MKHWYRHWLVAFFALGSQAAQAQNWRPFRPNGDVHAFRNPAADTIWTLRLDSAAVSGPDSVYYFNRTVKRTGNGSTLAGNWRKSANNQLGKLLRYNPARREYLLHWEGGSANGMPLSRGLVLRPFAKAGDSWSSYFTDYGVATTLVSRGLASIDGAPDSIATFQVGGSMQIVLSKNNGLVSAPRDMAFGLPSAKMLTLARRPDAAGRSYYNPLTLLDLQPGDELGYYMEPQSISSFSCFNTRTLRRIVSRQLTADSLVYIFREQTKTTYSGVPGCGTTGSSMSPVGTFRLAASRRTGAWTSNRNIELLAYEYKRNGSGSTASLSVGHPVVPARAGSTCGGAALLMQADIYPVGNGTYRDDPGIDLSGWQQREAAGVGVVRLNSETLVYVRRTVGGNPQICGNGADFATLLPVKAAQAVAPLQLYPNPATAHATLVLPAAARATATMRLLDALGRPVWTLPLPAGQATAALPLRGLAAGLYVVEVRTAGEPTQRIRLQVQE